MSTGFLEELSLKYCTCTCIFSCTCTCTCSVGPAPAPAPRYIQQTEELNLAVKEVREAIGGVVRREEEAKEREGKREREVARLVGEVEEMRSLVERSREEVVTRHGLLVVVEAAVLLLVLLCCRGGRGRGAVQGRRASLESGLKVRREGEVEVRRRSIETGATGAMVEEEATLTKKQRKRKRRRESANLLR